MKTAKERNVNRYSVFCATHGCTESRCTGLREARREVRWHRASRCRASMEIVHYTTSDESNGRVVETF